MNRVDSCNLHERQSIEFAFFLNLIKLVIKFLAVWVTWLSNSPNRRRWRIPGGGRLTRQLAETRGRPLPDSAVDWDPRASAAWLGNRRGPEDVSCLTRQQTGTRGRQLPDSATDGDQRASAAWLGSRRRPVGVGCLILINKTAIVGLWWFLVKTFVQQP